MNGLGTPPLQWPKLVNPDTFFHATERWANYKLLAFATVINPATEVNVQEAERYHFFSKCVNM